MELRRYFNILLRYWWLILLFTLAGGVLAFIQYKSTSANYQAVFEVNIQRNLPPPDQTNKGFQDYFDYYRALSAEYVLDDYVKISKGSLFLGDVAERLKNTSYPLSVDELKGSFEIERKHRELTFIVRADTEDKVMVVAKALSDNMEQNAGKYLARSAEQENQISGKTIDFPSNPVYNSGRNLLVASIRLIVGIIIGAGLAFLLAYLDNRLRTPDDFREVLGLPIIGQIPARSRFGFRGNSNNPESPSRPAPERETAPR
jgi:capsular polysaccharide biosynthesis protein